MKILHCDMDRVLADFDKQYAKYKKDHPNIEYPQSMEKFFLDIEPIKDGIEILKELGNHFDVYILTAPSYKNPFCYI